MLTATCSMERTASLTHLNGVTVSLCLAGNVEHKNGLLLPTCLCHSDSALRYPYNIETCMHIFVECQSSAFQLLPNPEGTAVRLALSSGVLRCCFPQCAERTDLLCSSFLCRQLASNHVAVNNVLRTSSAANLVKP